MSLIIVPQLYVLTAVQSYGSRFPQLYSPTALCSNSCIVCVYLRVCVCVVSEQVTSDQMRLLLVQCVLQMYISLKCCELLLDRMLYKCPLLLSVLSVLLQSHSCIVPRLYVHTALKARSCMFLNPYSLTALCSHSCKYCPTVFCSIGSVFPQLRSPTNLCAHRSMLYNPKALSFFNCIIPWLYSPTAVQSNRFMFLQL